MDQRAPLRQWSSYIAGLSIISFAQQSQIATQAWRVCGDEEATCVLVPCGHRCMCLICFNGTVSSACTLRTHLKVGRKEGFHADCKCPLCRTVVREVVTLHE